MCKHKCPNCDNQNCCSPEVDQKEYEQAIALLEDALTKVQAAALLANRAISLYFYNYPHNAVVWGFEGIEQHLTDLLEGARLDRMEALTSEGNRSYPIDRTGATDVTKTLRQVFEDVYGTSKGGDE